MSFCSSVTVVLPSPLFGGQDLAAAERKEAARAAAMAGKTIDLEDGHVDLGFQFNPAAHCYICKQRGHTKVGPGRRRLAAPRRV